ncbi:aminoglycoside phosphotransferase family protein [Streptomyces sp. TRM 70361]|uniref:aminoglycoside phosphotransferase family protein n=1 Tax=Streptomyces sp. TRM 70361 TaxID=3116553 RepID=UPI002E7B88A0|nr:aminoglycoside phosphotransferase family protein [Streptomyces sp. TRM 70361]MEE1941904.1 aminoglycoside phosphotransferase family protein [Streptomyces sp. TRM 70361]
MSSAELVPPALPVVRTVRGYPGGRVWLDRLPGLIGELTVRWELEPGEPFTGGSCSWVAPVRRVDGSAAVLKIGWPHREAAGEGEALRLWDGRGAVRLYEHDPERYALLLERCEPGTELRDAGELPAEERLVLGARALRGLWEAPVPSGTGLERVADVTAEWAGTAEERMARLSPPGFDPALVALGVRLLRELPATADREVVVHGDFNPGNVLAARRGWLAIDAKPMVGDPLYDPWPLIEQIDDPFARPDPRPVVAARCALVAGVLGADVARLQAWAVARRVEEALWRADVTGDPAGGAALLRQVRVLADLAGL